MVFGISGRIVQWSENVSELGENASAKHRGRVLLFRTGMLPAGVMSR